MKQKIYFATFLFLIRLYQTYTCTFHTVFSINIQNSVLNLDDPKDAKQNFDSEPEHAVDKLNL